MVGEVIAAAVRTPADDDIALLDGSVIVASKVCEPMAVSGVVGIVPEYILIVLEFVTDPTSAVDCRFALAWDTFI